MKKLSGCALVLCVFVIAGCSSTSPVGSPPSGSTSAGNDTLYMENRGGPEFQVYVNDQFVADLRCGVSTGINPGIDGVPLLPWKLQALRLDPKSFVMTEQVTQLPQTLVQFGAETPVLTGIILGPVITCPPAPTPPPPPSTTDPYAGLPSNACGGFHLKIVNDASASVNVTINETWHETVAPGTSNVINYAFSTPRPPEFPWHVVVTSNSTGLVMLQSTMDTPVDQKVTVSDSNADQTPYDLMAEGC